MKEEINGKIGESPEAGNTALAIDSGIFRMLGFRHEIQESIVKVWPREVEVPDETNWVLLRRFTEHLEDSIAALSGYGFAVTMHEEGGWHWAVLKAGDSEVETDEFATPELAAAAGLYAVLHAVANK